MLHEREMVYITCIYKLIQILKSCELHRYNVSSIRGVIRKFAENSCHVHRLINRAGITVHNTATHMQFIDYNMLDVSSLCVLQLTSRQRYIVRTGPSYLAF